ncbi:hypothetical protein AVEN_253900-1 [Araneus ventricosus]|uniref:Uncharacterized protein n=1 Tax=Araneus ventricosus TaxID=182803 RepID=A0A4Y2LVY2_ARAVE|nr:hypothetical protein AVEN_253900-1 [Araneus ventricosus]
MEEVQLSHKCPSLCLTILSAKRYLSAEVQYRLLRSISICGGGHVRYLRTIRISFADLWNQIKRRADSAWPHKVVCQRCSTICSFGRAFVPRSAASRPWRCKNNYQDIQVK